MKGCLYMNDVNSLRFLLHVSDFHLTDNEEELKFAKDALKELTDTLKEQKIKVDYLIHTGDVINSSDLYEKTASKLDSCKPYIEEKKDEKGKQYKEFNSKKFKREATDEQKIEFDDTMKKIAKKRFDIAKIIMEEFISELNISFGSVVICSGNHDVLRLMEIDNDSIKCIKEDNDNWRYEHPENLKESLSLFEEFLNSLSVANSAKRCGKVNSSSFCNLDNLKILLLNTNWATPPKHKKGYYCTRCDSVRATISDIGDVQTQNELNIVIAHKPIYEICEKARLPYKRYIKTNFMSDLQKFVGNNGIYLCGDKHTRSIAGSFIHDIPHYIGGEPLIKSSKEDSPIEVEYNLLEIKGSSIGMERKIHLKSIDDAWHCEIRPQDSVVSKLYEKSKNYITPNTYGLIGDQKVSRTWESVCQEIYNWSAEERKDWYENLNSLFQPICKYRIKGSRNFILEKENVFKVVLDRLNKHINKTESRNILNIRGEHTAGKSSFLGLLYIYLLYNYSVGSIDYIPAYFNLESDEIEADKYYNKSVKDAFERYAKEIQEIADKEHQSICYIIDGLDEQDCWSNSTEDSVGRGILDVLSEQKKAWYIMSFSQQKLPRFKNTMPERKYNDTSDIMYFNPIDVREKDSEDRRFYCFVKAFLNLRKNIDRTKKLKDSADKIKQTGEPEVDFVEDACSIIRNFRRLTINYGFMHQNCGYITELGDEEVLKHKSSSVFDVCKYYIDSQEQFCLEKLHYGYVNYAPAMAYLFTYKGYTYEKFKSLCSNLGLRNQHIFTSIAENRDNIYRTFLFIKKHKDAREYLIALHYNREIRYYAEHPDVNIDEDSILNEFIERNISIIIRKLWTDTNKFVIACEQLLKRKDLNECLRATLIYCLAHLSVYPPIRDSLFKQIKNMKEEQFLPATMDELKIWALNGKDNEENLNEFIKLSLKHSIEIFECMDKYNSIGLVRSILSNESFKKYNRQYQMLYYGDLCIRGENKRRPLNPGIDTVYKGFDFHNCFNYLYIKLASEEKYPLREFDMFTMWDLILSRLLVEQLEEQVIPNRVSKTFFYHDDFFKTAIQVLEQAKSIFDLYISENQNLCDDSIYKLFCVIRDCLNEICEVHKSKNSDKTIRGIVESKKKEYDNLVTKEKS